MDSINVTIDDLFPPADFFEFLRSLKTCMHLREI